MIGRQLPYGHKLDRAALDITKPERIGAALNQFQPKAVIHLAGLNLQQCARAPDLAHRINVVGAENVARECAVRGIRLVYVSTCAVFWGALHQSFDEDVPPLPRHVYGVTKLEAERCIQSITPKHLIVRTGWVFGGHGAHHRKFVDIILEAIDSRQPVHAHEAQTGSPTSVADFCFHLKTLTDSTRIGVVHLVNRGVATPRDIAKFVLARYDATDLLCADPPVLLEEGRSPSEAMVSTLLHLRPWQEALRDYLEECDKRARPT